ncbi:MAG: Fe-S cluster assembly sulfur transfer protein SufU, partial [Bacteroidota bacterium]
IDHADHSAKGHNPLCGDQIDVYISMDGDKISEIKFEGAGCAISKASASIMTTILKGKTKEEARKIFEEFHELVTNDNKNPDEIDIGKLAVFCGVREFPARVKCASLAWHTMINALAEKGKDFISTE